jgi:hypothetical protein
VQKSNVSAFLKGWMKGGWFITQVKGLAADGLANDDERVFLSAAGTEVSPGSANL